jgi:Arc/MetJ-type ribon-helix-helix transcriptional regulator
MRRKVALSTSISPKIGKRIDNAMESGDYASQSDLLQIALSEYFTREEIREHQDKLIAVYRRLLEDDEGRRLLKDWPKDKATQIESLKKKGMACVELGDLDEAMKCFAKAKELESQDLPKKPDEQPGKKSQVLFSGSPDDYPQHNILE